MAAQQEATAPRSCRECGQLLELDALRPTGEVGGVDETELDWADFCPSPDCPIKTGD
ncbi:MAG: hypothetical protein V9G19_23120 [Tetrasphaera sp.]